MNIDMTTNNQKQDTPFEQAVRKAFLEHHKDDEFNRINDATVDALGDDYPLETPMDISVIKRLFMILPMEIVFDMAKWGGSDTCVGDAIYGFVEDNKELVLSVIAGEKS